MISLAHVACGPAIATLTCWLCVSFYITKTNQHLKSMMSVTCCSKTWGRGKQNTARRNVVSISKSLLSSLL